jgi:hypothetical protein
MVRPLLLPAPVGLKRNSAQSNRPWKALDFKQVEHAGALLLLVIGREHKLVYQQAVAINA